MILFEFALCAREPWVSEWQVLHCTMHIAHIGDADAMASLAGKMSARIYKAMHGARNEMHCKHCKHFSCHYMFNNNNHHRNNRACVCVWVSNSNAFAILHTETMQMRRRARNGERTMDAEDERPISHILRCKHNTHTHTYNSLFVSLSETTSTATATFYHWTCHILPGSQSHTHHMDQSDMLSSYKCQTVCAARLEWNALIAAGAVAYLPVCSMFHHVFLLFVHASKRTPSIAPTETIRNLHIIYLK